MLTQQHFLQWIKNLIRPFKMALTQAEYIRKKKKAGSFCAVLFNGSMIPNGQPINLLYLGADDHRWNLNGTFFDGKGSQTFLSKVPAFSGHYEPFLTNAIDLIVCEVVKPSIFKQEEPLLVPPFIDMIVTLPNSEDEFKKNVGKNIRQKINDSLKEGFTKTLANSIEDYRYFYDNLYVPMMKSRHQQNAVIPDFENLSKERHRESIVFVMKANERIAGAQLSWPSQHSNSANYKGGECRFVRIGLREDFYSDPRQYRLLNTAAYFYNITTAIEKGCKTFNFGITPPALNNGIFIHKSRWGAIAKVSPNPIRWAVFFPKPEKMIALLREKPLLAFRNNELVGMTGIQDTHLSDQTRQLLIRDFKIGGIAKLIVRTPIKEEEL